MVNSKCKSCESFKNGCAGMNSNFTGCIYYKKLEGLSVDKDIIKITPEEASQIIESRERKGLFYCIDNGRYVGIDNRTGDAWTEDFSSLAACKRWLTKQ